MVNTIRRNLALKEYDIKEAPDGKQVVFSIKFIKKNGELVFLSQTVASGLKFNEAEHRMRGVVPVDERGNRLGHVYPVCIDAIVEWDGKKVVM